MLSEREEAARNVKIEFIYSSIDLLLVRIKIVQLIIYSQITFYFDEWLKYLRRHFVLNKKIILKFTLVDKFFKKITNLNFKDIFFSTFRIRIHFSIIIYLISRIYSECK